METAALGRALVMVVTLVLVCMVMLAVAKPSTTNDKDGAANEAALALDDGEECVSGHRKVDGHSDCGANCYCLGGQWVCPECVNEGPSTQKLRAEDFEPLPLRRSKRVPLDGERCAPGVTYMDECNTCICSQDGIKAHASCTFKVCPK